MNVRDFFRRVKVIPVSVVETDYEALKLSETLVAESVNLIEITMRTQGAADCIKAVKKRFPEMIVGAGSVLTLESFRAAADAGVDFAVSPVCDLKLLGFAGKSGIPFVPGISTPSELNSVLGLADVIKVFPAEQLGGPAYINAISAPFKMMDFDLMPTGGIHTGNIASYLSTDRVSCCGLSQIADRKLLSSGDYTGLRQRIREVLDAVPERLRAEETKRS